MSGKRERLLRRQLRSLRSSVLNHHLLEVTRAKGVMVQVGMGGAVPDFPMMMLIGKEIALKGSFRFTTEFNTAVSWLANNVIDPLPLLSAEYPFTELEQALILPGIKPVQRKSSSFLLKQNKEEHNERSFSLDGKNILITGSARGIGYLLATGLGKYGAQIIVNDITPERAEAAVAKLQQEGSAPLPRRSMLRRNRTLMPP